MTATAIDNHPFEPFPLLENAHLMTIVPALIPRYFNRAARFTKRIFSVAPDAKVLTHCHWQKYKRKSPTLLILHGLEGSSDSNCVIGLTNKAFARSFNVVRMNMRNCGGSHNLTPTLYDSGMSHDVIAILKELKEEIGDSDIFLTGWSMGGNIILKAAAELAEKGRGLLAGVCAISPALDLLPCVDVVTKGFNRVYEHIFLSGLKTMMRKKEEAFPGLYDLSVLDNIATIRDFDETFTAQFGGWGTAENYYSKASALPIMPNIQVPTLILQAKDDPLIPYSSFESPLLVNNHIQVMATQFGGHCGFFQKLAEDEPDLDRFWAENRVINFLLTTIAKTNGR